MDEIVKSELSKYLETCEQSGLVCVCKKKSTPEGKEFVISRLYDLMQKYPSWSAAECLSQVEIQLNEMENY